MAKQTSITRNASGVALALILATGLNTAAFAQAVSDSMAPVGCNNQVYDSLKKTAQAQATYAKSVIDEIASKNDSVLSVSCFNKAAGYAAQQAGELFSGDFSIELAPIVQDSLVSMLTNFGDSVGAISGSVDYSFSAMKLPTVDITDGGSTLVAAIVPPDTVATFDCAAPGDLWATVNTEGIDPHVPYVSVYEMDANPPPYPAPPPTPLGTPPTGAGANFLTSWNSAASQNAIVDMNVALTNLPNKQVPGYTGITSLCDVMKTAGVLPTISTCPY